MVFHKRTECAAWNTLLLPRNVTSAVIKRANGSVWYCNCSISGMISKTSSPNEVELPGESAKERRRGKRLYLNYSIEMSGIDYNGQPFIERTKTENISDTGCRIRTEVHLKAGDTVDVRLILPEDAKPSTEEARRFMVMWVARRPSGWSIGARMVQPGKFWKVTFPASKKSSEPSAK